jgi:hypothetical protein
MFKDELHIHPKKLKVMLNSPTPHNVVKVRTFHGLIVFCMKFMRGFSGIYTLMVVFEIIKF